MDFLGQGIVRWNTIYGHVYSGMIKERDMYLNLVNTLTDEELNGMIKQLLESETIPGDEIDTDLSEEQIRASQKLQEQLKWNEKTGSYECGLILKDKVILKNNYDVAKKRFDTFMKRVNADPNIAKVWLEKFKELEEYKVIQLVHGDPYQPGRVYMGFSLVHRPYSTTTAWRLCTDASIKAGKFSLNENILDCPNLCNYLRSVELLSRSGDLYFAGDIKKMYLTINTIPEEQIIHILWKDPNEPDDTPPRVYQITATYWGVKSSGAIAMAALRKTFKEVYENPNSSQLEKWVALTAVDHFYVDDGSFGPNGKFGALFTTVEEMYQYYVVLDKILKAKGFIFRKIVSSSSEFLQRIPEDRRAKTKLSARNYLISETNTQLGYQFNMEDDTIEFTQYKDVLKYYDGTKRSLASLQALIFDPLTLLGGWNLVARQVLQKTFESKMDWNDKLEDHLDMDTMKKLNKWLLEIPLVSEIKVPRSFKPTPGFKNSKMILYSDASFSGIGAVCYCVSHWPDGSITSRIVQAAAKVSPKKDKNLTTPKLELRALTVALELQQHIKKSFNLSDDKFEFFTDNKAVLYWTRKDPEKLSPFFANRVRKWRNAGLPPPSYVPTKENPADEISRGMDIFDLRNTKYWNGPSYHLLPRSEWPVEDIPLEKADEKISITLEEKLQGHLKKHQDTIVSLHLMISNRKGSKAKYLRKRIATNTQDSVPLITKYSDYDRLVRVCAILYGAIDKWIVYTAKKCPDSDVALKRTTVTAQQFYRDPKRFLYIDPKYLRKAQNFLIRQMQIETWPIEYKRLEKDQKVHEKSVLSSFSPMIGCDKCIRMRGRMQKSDLSWEETNPYLIPAKHILTRMIIRYYHTKYKHAPSSTLDNILRRQFWIVQGKVECRRVVEECFLCKKSNARLSHQRMGPLHDSILRYQITRPFRALHIDYTGSLQILDRPMQIGEVGLPPLRTTIIALFTDPLSRWLHLELVPSQSGPDLMDAWTRFVAVCGEPEQVFSDGATCFKFLSNVLKEKSNLNNNFHTDHPGLQYLISKTSSEWSFIISGASHRMSIIENQVKAVKKSLYKVLQPRMTMISGHSVPTRYLNVTEDRLKTILAEIVIGLNDRILAPKHMDLKDNPLPITPSLLHLNRYLQPTITSFSNCQQTLDIDIHQIWKTRKTIRQEFFQRYFDEIVPSLQRTFKWDTLTPPLKKDHIVLVQDKSDTIRSQYWRLAVIKEVYKGGDGLVRSVTVNVPRRKTVDGIMLPSKNIDLSVTQVCPLEGPQKEVTFDERVQIIDNENGDITIDHLSGKDGDSTIVEPEGSKDISTQESIEIKDTASNSIKEKESDYDSNSKSVGPDEVLGYYSNKKGKLVNLPLRRSERSRKQPDRYGFAATDLSSEKDNVLTLILVWTSNVDQTSRN